MPWEGCRRRLLHADRALQAPDFAFSSMPALIATPSRPTHCRSAWVTCSTAPKPGSSQPGGGDGRQQRAGQQQRGSRLKGAQAEAVAAGGRPRRWCVGFAVWLEVVGLPGQELPLHAVVHDLQQPAADAGCRSLDATVACLQVCRSHSSPPASGLLCSRQQAWRFHLPGLRCSLNADVHDASYLPCSRPGRQRGEGDTLLRDVNRDRLMGLLTER